MAEMQEEYQVAVSEVTEFEGDIPREETSKVHWIPCEGALLASGIRVTGNFWPAIDPEALSMAGMPKWRINLCVYLLNQWCKEHDPQQPISPSYFLAWLKDNPAPALDFQGRPIDASALSVAPVFSGDTEPPISFEDNTAPATEHPTKQQNIPGLSTPDIAAAFCGIAGWDKNKWAKNLTQSKWVKAAIVSPGRRGKGGEAYWAPVELAKLVQDKHRIPIKKLNMLFKKTPSLAPWQDEWKQYEEKLADY